MPLRIRGQWPATYAQTYFSMTGYFQSRDHSWVLWRVSHPERRQTGTSFRSASRRASFGRNICSGRAQRHFTMPRSNLQSRDNCGSRRAARDDDHRERQICGSTPVPLVLGSGQEIRQSSVRPRYPATPPCSCHLTWVRTRHPPGTLHGAVFPRRRGSQWPISRLGHQHSADVPCRPARVQAIGFPAFPCLHDRTPQTPPLDMHETTSGGGPSTNFSCSCIPMTRAGIQSAQPPRGQRPGAWGALDDATS